MDSLNSLNRQRGSIKGKLTRINGEIAALNTTETEVTVFEEYLRDVDNAFQEFTKIKTRILEEIDNLEFNQTKTADEIQIMFDDQDAKFSEIEREFVLIRSKLRTCINLHKTVENNNSNNNSNNPPPHQPTSKIQLPKLKLPVFTGKYEEYPSFKEKFYALVHNNNEVPIIQRFQLLLDSLSEEVRKGFDYLEFSEKNYKVVLEGLEKRYHNKKLSIDRHISGLVKLKSMAKESAAEVQKILDVTSIHVEALKSLGIDVSSWDCMIIYLVSVKLDAETRKKWEEKIDKDDLPTWDDMRKFLQKRCNSLESVELAVDFKKKTFVSKDSKPVKSHVVSSESGCAKCGENHELSNCRSFVALPLDKKFEFVKSKRMCFNCLKTDHMSRECSSEITCTKCPKTVKKKHCLLLHVGKSKQPVEEKSDEKSKESVVCNCSVEKPLDKQVILMTAMVLVYGIDDQPYLARALLDGASEVCFVTSEFASKLGIKQTPINQTVIGIQANKSSCGSKLKAYIRSRHKDFGKVLDFLVVDRVTRNIPHKSFSIRKWNIPSSIVLADPEFNKSGVIDLLIGAEVFTELMMSGCKKLRDDLPYLQESVLGWVWSGKLFKSRESESDEVSCNLVTNDELSDQLERFFRIEMPGVDDEKSLEEHLCEEQFVKTVSRSSDGRYEVSLPLNDKAPLLGESRPVAVSCLNSLTKKLSLNPEIKQLYKEYIEELLRQGHMRKVERERKIVHGVFYLPHHCILKPDSSTTKLRIVFNASQKSSSGLSLNDIMMKGGIVQKPMISIMIRHRLHKIAFGFDVKGMYRQIKIKPEFVSLQSILYRETLDDPIVEYEIVRLIDGTKAAPFLATRTMIQIAEDYAEEFPLASKCLKNDMHVDDGLSGSNSIQEAIDTRDEIIAVLRRAGMECHKWCSNDERLLDGIPIEKIESKLFDDKEDNKTVKTLGTLWNMDDDSYRFVVPSVFESKVTKRIVLSELARIFDPLGLINPITVTAKIFLQKLWALNYDWDDELSDELVNEWVDYRYDLRLVENISIPRWVNPACSESFELIGYSDASKDAYGMCIYLRCIGENGDTCRLIYSKSRIASPGKSTIPRLELDAALLLADGVDFIRKAIGLKFRKIRLFSDSKVVLAWLKTDVLQLQIYVANRVRKIRNSCADCEWGYISTKSNPADIVSRGISSTKLKESDLWWYGPLLETQECDNEFDNVELNLYQSEIRKSVEPVCLLSLQESESCFKNLFSRISKFRLLQRSVAWMNRFIWNCRMKGEDRKFGRITTAELNESLRTLVKVVQKESFENELKMLDKNGSLPPKHPLKALNVMYTDGLIRVGGRISNSSYCYDKKHQMLLPKYHVFTEMVVKDLHVRFLHVGPQGLLSIIRERFWILNGRNVIRKLLHGCIDCFKAKPRTVEPFMGDLPNFRVEPSLPFIKSGVDYAGPIYLKIGTPRSRTLIKAWIAVFICLVTKAVHLELVTSLTSEAFRAVLQRFIGRRGRPNAMYSDNGTNFIGCKRELEELRILFNKQNQNEIAEFCTQESIEWFTIPPRASHFGGEWEAAVKSMKHHYKRIAGNSNLTYEENLTLLIQIEGILNSRPLYAMSSDPNDFSPLTPAHFLIGRSLISYPEPNLVDTNSNYLSRYQRVTQLRQSFWKRFCSEYITSLQVRSKWFKSKPCVKLGQLALIKDENQPSFNWRTGRIVKLYPGKDGIVRVVVLRLSNGKELKRDTQKICILPLETDVTE